MKKTLLVIIFLVSILNCFSQWNNSTAINNIVSNRTGDDYDPVAVSDGANGSINFFIDYTLNGNFYAQKITSAGVVAWGSTENPVDICITPTDKYDLKAIPDGSGGAFVSWSDYRNNPDSGDIYIQKINSAGVVQWGANGLRVTTTGGKDDFSPVMCSDGAGGVIVAWYWDDAIIKNVQAFAQRFNSSGTALWPANGVQVCTTNGFRAGNAIVPDGNNGAILFFIDTRNDPQGFDYDYLNNQELTNSDVYAQRLSGAGARLWTNDGVAVCTASGNQNYDFAGGAIPDGSGGAIYVFDDGRNDNGNYINYDIFAQRINNSGVSQWAPNGIPVCTAPGNQYLTDGVSDGAGGVVLSIDYETTNRIYTQRIDPAGNILWTTNGVPVTEATEQVYDASIINDGSGNTIFTYGSSANNGLLKAQKINSTGALQWGTSGVIVSNAAFGISYYSTGVVPSDNGSVIISWSDSRNYTITFTDIFASKLLPNGTLDGTASTLFITATDGDWDNPATWVGGIVPPAGAAVKIKHIVSCNVNTSCSSLHVEQPAGDLTILTGFTITITN